MGYGDISNESVVGRLTAMVLLLTGIVLFGALTSTITSFFMVSNDPERGEYKEEIKELNDKISQLLMKIENMEKNAYIKTTRTKESDSFVLVVFLLAKHFHKLNNFYRRQHLIICWVNDTIEFRFVFLVNFN